MSTFWWKKCLLGAYYGAMLPARRRAAAQRAARQTEPVRILFYHRIADGERNDWTMPRAIFEAQVAWLHARFDIFSLSEAQARIASGRNSRPTVCITFDDGYADNMQFAVPLLLKHKIPFTYFVSTDHVIRGQIFPHDAKAGKPLPPNTVDHLRELASAGVEIGAHTHSHADLGANLPAAQVIEEIAGCKRELETLLSTSIRYFAFPYGQHRNLTSQAFRAAYQAGYEGVCSAYGGYNFPGEDRFHLRRFHADPEMIRFKNWMAVDPRKLRLHRDFDPGPFRKAVHEGSGNGAKAQNEIEVQAQPNC